MKSFIFTEKGINKIGTEIKNMQKPLTKSFLNFFMYVKTDKKSYIRKVRANNMKEAKKELAKLLK